MTTERSLTSYLNEMAGMTPTPGGGSAAACVGALALSLLSMVTRYSMRRQKKSDRANHLKKIIKLNESKRRELIRLMRKDESTYKRLSSALKKKKKTDTSTLYKAAARVPLEMCGIMIDGIGLCCKVLPYCRNAIMTDLIEAMILLEAGYKAAELNVKVNLVCIKDRGFKMLTNAKLAGYSLSLRKIVKIASKVK